MDTRTDTVAEQRAIHDAYEAERTLTAAQHHAERTRNTWDDALRGHASVDVRTAARTDWDNARAAFNTAYRAWDNARDAVRALRDA